MNKQIDIISDLLIDFDEMGFFPTTSCPDSYAIEWRNKITDALKGYRTELAMEIFAEIEKMFHTDDFGDFVIDNMDFQELKRRFLDDGS